MAPAEGENYANPKTCFFHVIFKAAALAFYILFSFFIKNFVIQFVITVLLAALDFWVVKNVSGRILVGLRWWNEINEQGESVWKFECLDQESLSRMNKKDSWLFWWTLYITAGVWVALGIVAIIRLNFDYLLVVGVCLTLSIANIIGFTKCRKGMLDFSSDFLRDISSYFGYDPRSKLVMLEIWFLIIRKVHSFPLLKFICLHILNIRGQLRDSVESSSFSFELYYEVENMDASMFLDAMQIIILLVIFFRHLPVICYFVMSVMAVPKSKLL